ncbi:MAG: isochorismatase family protein [Rhodospirillales bacterium]
MSASVTALLVIDAQESFRQRDHWSETDAAPYVERQQALIDGAVAQGLPVLQVFHEETGGPFDPASGFVRTLEPLHIEPNAVFRKQRHSALVGTGLDVYLVSRGIRRLLISGLRTEQCCETTTRHASDLGFEVDFVSEATHTLAMTAPGGGLVTAGEIKWRTELVLADRFARVVTVEQALADSLGRKAA